MIFLEGGIEARGTIHRVFAIILMVLSCYHLLYLLFSETGHAQLMKAIPRLKDLKDLGLNFQYNLGLKKERVEFGWFDFRQKFQYWGVVIGTVIMTLTGLILWFETQAIAIMPKWIWDITVLIHGGGGLLIFLILLVWHLYNVHLSPEVFPMSKTWIHGKILIEELKKRHFLAYQEMFSDSSEES